MYAADTTVPVSKTRAEIELLQFATIRQHDDKSNDAIVEPKLDACEEEVVVDGRSVLLRFVPVDAARVRDPRADVRAGKPTQSRRRGSEGLTVYDEGCP